MNTETILQMIEQWGCLNVSGSEQTQSVKELVESGNYKLETVPSASCGTLTIILPVS